MDRFARMTKLGRAAVGAGIRVLLIDDSAIALDFQKRLLLRYGFEVRCCAALAELAAAVDGWSPSVIVTDVDLPEAEHTDVVSMLREQGATKGIPVVLCSGLPLEELGAMAARRNVAGFVSKSDNIEALPAELRRVCEPA
jgi:chemosensory pili system protein ChpA (sensor histidine kinase/response regulator)